MFWACVATTVNRKEPRVEPWTMERSGLVGIVVGSPSTLVNSARTRSAFGSWNRMEPSASTPVNTDPGNVTETTAGD